MGGLIDELNYMSVVEKSKVAVDKGTYDQAILLYNSIARRRKSRFMENGKLPGILCLGVFEEVSGAVHGPEGGGS